MIILGIHLFVRLVETSVENVVSLRRIEAIRRYYATLDTRYYRSVYTECTVEA